jgi:hypothetical protein
VALATLDQDERGKQKNRAGKPEHRACRAPADVNGIDNRVDE